MRLVNIVNLLHTQPDQFRTNPIILTSVSAGGSLSVSSRFCQTCHSFLAASCRSAVRESLFTAIFIRESVCLVNDFVHGRLLVAGTRHNVLVITGDVAAQHGRGFL